MARGHPDFTPVVPEIIGAKPYTDYSFWAWGLVDPDSYVETDVLTVPSGYEVTQSLSIVSAKGCDFCHGFEMFINAVLRHTDYFTDVLTVPYSRYLTAVGGDEIKVRFYNYDAVARYFLWSSLGVRIEVGTKPPPYQHDPGKPPKLGNSEKLWFIEDKMYGRRWVKAKQFKIKSPLDQVLEYIENSNRRVK